MLEVANWKLAVDDDRLLPLCPADDPQVGPPRADFVRVLSRDDSGDLNAVIEVVGDPGGEQLAQRDDAECGVFTATLQIRLG